MRIIKLTPRKQAVLAAVVKAYIETGEPIGSKNLMQLLENAPSSATLRNEMNELCSMGFLNQPHTSAGRVPTSRGYEFYIGSVMKPDAVTSSAKSFIERELCAGFGDPEEIHRRAAGALSTLTGFPAVLMHLVGDGITLRSVKLLPIARRSAVLLMITSDGRTYSRVCRMPENLSGDIAERFCEIVKSRLKMVPLSSFSKALLQTVTASVGLEVFSLLPLFTELFDMANRAARSSITFEGGQRLYSFCSESDSHRIMSLISAEEPFIKLLSGGGDKIATIFGNDTEFAELSGTVVITAPYYVASQYCGRIGIIGSRRMPYAQIYPSVEYAAERLSKLMTEVAKDMED